MIDDFVRHLQVLSKADTLIARIWLTAMARRFALFAFAGLIAVFGLGMADLAAFYQLEAMVGAVWAAAIVALADFAVAAIIALLARFTRPGPEIDLALEVRGMAIKSLQEDARELEAAARGLAQQVRDAKDSLSGFVSHPLDAAAQKLIIPAIIALVRGLRGRHGKSEEAEGS